MEKFPARSEVLSGPWLRLMSEVEQWGIVPMHRKPNLADHTFFVIAYVDELCALLAIPPDRHLRLLRHAIRHDVPETVTGDIMGPVKRGVVIPALLVAMEERAVRRFNWSLSNLEGQDYHIFKAADNLEQVWRIAWEEAKGNRMAQPRVEYAPPRVRFIEHMKELDLEATGYDILTKIRTFVNEPKFE